MVLKFVSTQFESLDQENEFLLFNTVMIHR